MKFIHSKAYELPDDSSDSLMRVVMLLLDYRKIRRFQDDTISPHFQIDNLTGNILIQFGKKETRSK